MFAAANEQSIAQPWFEKAIFIRFIKVYRTAENDFNIFWMCKEHNQFWTNPNSGQIRINFAQFESQLQNFLTKQK